jgi:hypothetical protein
MSHGKFVLFSPVGDPGFAVGKNPVQSAYGVFWIMVEGIFRQRERKNK